MRQSNSSKVSLLSLTLLIFSAGIMEIVSPYPTKARATKDGNSAPAFLTAQVTPQVSPQATPSPVNPELGNREGGDGTLWWLLLLCLGLPFLLAWLGSKRGATTEKSSTLILTPETGQTARIYWEISPEKIQGLRRGGKNLAIRLTDVTNINPQVTNPQLVQQVDCSLSSPLISLQVPEIDREYQAELGCVTNDGGWVSLVKSAPAYFPALHPFLGGLGAGIVTAIGSTVINSFEPQNETPQEANLPKVVDKVDVGENLVNSLNSMEDAGVIDHPAGDLEVDLWNDLSPPITADLGIEEPEVLLPKVEVIDNPEAIDNLQVKDIDSSVDSQTEDLLEGMNTPLPAIVPTVDDGGNSLDWGITGGAAGVVQLQKDDEVKDEIVVDESLPRINLLPSDESTINGSWILPESIKATYQNQGGSKLALRVYDVTGIDPEMSLAGTFQQFAVEETGLITSLTLQDLPHNQHNQINDLPNTETDSELLYRDYQGELGYLTATDEWLGVAKSNRVRLPLVGETQIQLDIHTPDQGYVYWEIAPRDEQSLKSQGCRDLILRIHDSTDIDIDCTPPHTTQEYAFDRGQRNFYVSIMIGDRPYGDYLAELGYITTTGEWRRIIRSLHTRFFRL